MGIISENIMHRVEEFGMNLPEQVNKSVIPHRNYENCSIYWCECGWFLRDKDHTPNYCPNCGKRIEWGDAE
jgi:hypothetical protein